MAAAHTKVSLVIPFFAIAVFSAAQFALGTSLAVVAMCAAAIGMPFIPLVLHGRDLYSVLGIAFSLKYAAVALIAKTLYGQTLESNLLDAEAAFAVTALVMASLTAMLAVARMLDRGTTLLPFSQGPQSLRQLSVISICAGIAGEILVASNKAIDTGVSSGGPLVVLGANLQNLFFLGLIAEACYAITKSGGRSFVTPRLLLFLLIELMIALALNARDVLVSCVICVITTAFLHSVLRPRHLLVGLAAGYFFMSFLTPVTLYLRIAKEGMSRTQFVEFAAETITRAAADPEFFQMMSDAVKSAAFQNEKAFPPYDYYGDRSNVLNRLSFVGEVDAVANGVRTRVPLGMAAIDQLIARTALGALGYDKQVSAYGMGDWLSWQTGTYDPGRISFLNFGLPMEGLAVWGYAGLIAYPFIFMLPVLYVCGRLSSLRQPWAISIFLFTPLQHTMLEGTSDALLAWFTRNLPLSFAILFILHKALYALPSPDRAPAGNLRLQAAAGNARWQSRRGR